MVACVPVAQIYRDRSCRRLYGELLFGEKLKRVLVRFSDGVALAEIAGAYGFVRLSQFGDLPGSGDLAEARFGADLLTKPDLKSEKITLVPRFSVVSVTGYENGFAQLCLPNQTRAYCLFCALKPRGAPRDPARAAVCDALELLGTPYRWGGRSPLGIDCSGLVSLCWRTYSVPQDTRLFCRYPRVADPNAVRRGDLVLFPGHVGIYLARGRFIHACAAQGCVTISSLDPRDDLFDAQHTRAGYAFYRIPARR